MNNGYSTEIKIAVLETQLSNCLAQVEKLQNLTDSHALKMRDLLNKQTEILSNSDKNGKSYNEALKTITNLQIMIDRLDRDLVRCKTEVETLIGDVMIFKSLPIDELKELPLKVDRHERTAKLGGFIATAILSSLIALVFNIISNLFKATIS